MEVLDLENEPALWLPLAAFSDPVQNGTEKGSFGVNLSTETNQFFRNLYFINISEEDDEGGTLLQTGMSLAADHSWEAGIVIVTHDNHLKVLSGVVEDVYGNKHIVPVVWNAKLKEESAVTSEDRYYEVYLVTEHYFRAGEGYAVIDASSNVFWTEQEEAALR